MKKGILILIVLMFSFKAIAQTRDYNFSEIGEFLQEFQTAVGGYYGTRVLRISKGMTNVTVEKYMKTWQANRCLLRGIIVAEEEDLVYNPDLNEYSLIVSLPKGKAFFSFQMNDKGFYRFIRYETEGNINSCPVGNTPTNNYYANVDIIGTWKFREATWNYKPESLKTYLRENGYDEAKIKSDLETRLKNLRQPEIADYTQIQFLPNGTAKIITKQGEKTIQWRLSYNQLQIKEESKDWAAQTWRIDNDGHLNWIDASADRDLNGELGFIFKK
jgi:hypothetical protein